LDNSKKKPIKPISRSSGN